MPRPALAALLTGLALTAACGDGERPAEDGPPPTATVVDSVFPIEEQIRRFQATVADTPSTFRGGAESRDDLVAAFLEAVASDDPTGLGDLVVDRSEYAFLYYPHSRYTTPPYQLPPEILWLQIQNTQSRSLSRLFRQLEERTLAPHGYRCEGEPLDAGPLRIWEDCFVMVPGGSEPVVDMRLFGSILEHEGRFKFLSLSNEL